MIAIIAAIAERFFLSDRSEKSEKKDKKSCTRENRDLNQNVYDKRQADSVLSKAKKCFTVVLSIKILHKKHLLNVNYVKKFKPRYPRAFSPLFFNPIIISNHILVILSHYLIMVSHKRIITLSYLGTNNLSHVAMISSHTWIIPNNSEIRDVYHKTLLSSNEGSAVEFREKIPRDKKSKQTNKQKQPKKIIWLS